MSTDEITRLRAENQRLRSLAVWAGRELQRVEGLAMRTLDDLAEQIEWTGESESLELAEAAATAFALALHAPTVRRLTAKDHAHG